MLIGILQCGHFVEREGAPYRSYIQLYTDMMAGTGLEMTGYSVVDMEFPESPTSCDGWLISGSKHGAYEDLPFIPKLEQFIRDAYAADVPMFGICFGHQIMAQALGGRVEKFEGGWAIGRTEYDFGDRKMAMYAWHQDQVLALPNDARRVASTDFCQNAAIAYKGKAYSVQPHPEFERVEMERLLDLRAEGLIPDSEIEKQRMLLDAPNDNAAMIEQIAAFFKEASNV